MQIQHIEADTKKSHQETLSTTNQIKEAVMENNCIFSRKWEVTHDQIYCCSEEHLLFKNCMVDLESLSGLQQTTLQHCQDTIAGLEETITQLVMSVKKLEKTVCPCHNWLLSPGPHYAPGEEGIVEDLEEEEEEEDGLKYKTEDTSKGSYTTPPSTGGHSEPSLAPVIGHYFCSYFSSIFNPTSLHIPYPTFFPHVYPCYVYPLMLFTLTNRRQEHNLIGTTGHRTTHLLGCQHSETVLLWFLLTWILRWNLLCRH